MCLIESCTVLVNSPSPCIQTNGKNCQHFSDIELFPVLIPQRSGIKKAYLAALLELLFNIDKKNPIRTCVCVYIVCQYLNIHFRPKSVKPKKPSEAKEGLFQRVLTFAFRESKVAFGTFVTKGTAIILQTGTLQGTFRYTKW